MITEDQLEQETLGWLAELGDFHTWVRPARTHGVLPYGACVVGGEVVLTHVPEWTAAWSHGVRPGWRLVGEPVRETWASTPAAPHVKPLLVARRILSGSFGDVRDLEARGPGARWARWSESWEPPTGAPVSTARTASVSAADSTLRICSSERLVRLQCVQV